MLFLPLPFWFGSILFYPNVTKTLSLEIVTFSIEYYVCNPLQFKQGHFSQAALQIDILFRLISEQHLVSHACLTWLSPLSHDAMNRASCALKEFDLTGGSPVNHDGVKFDSTSCTLLNYLRASTTNPFKHCCWCLLCSNSLASCVMTHEHTAVLLISLEV